jgi:UDP-N-acetylglucosamine acyltransferase
VDIHPTAVVDPRAELGHDLSIGPFCLVEAGAILGDGCKLLSRATVKSGVVLGKNNILHEGAVLGAPPQHATAKGPFGRVVIGDNNTFRECATVHRSLYADQGTTIASDCYLMVNAHVGHDCRIDSGVILGNNAAIGGHVTVGRKAFVSALVAVHQFCRIGSLAMVGGCARIVQDVPPYVMIDGDSSKIVGLNLVGLKRAGFTHDQIGQLKAAYRLIYRGGLLWTNLLAALKERFPEGPAAAFHPFFVESKRGMICERREARGVTVKFPGADQSDSQELRKAG